MSPTTTTGITGMLDLTVDALTKDFGAVRAVDNVSFEIEPRPRGRSARSERLMLRALVHAASAELQAGRIPEAQIQSALVTTVLGALTAPPTTSGSADA